MSTKEKAAPKAHIEDFFNKVVLAFSTNPRQGTATVYSDGVKVADWRDKSDIRRPSLDFIRAQAQRHVKYATDGNKLVEISLDWPHPDVLETYDEDKPTVPVGAPNDFYDQDVVRTNSE